MSDIDYIVGAAAPHRPGNPTLDGVVQWLAHSLRALNVVVLISMFAVVFVSLVMLICAASFIL